jgi:hypothetical protein
VTPPIVPMLEGSNPQGDEKNTEPEQVVVGDVVGLMRSFQRMSEALINHLDRDEGRAFVPNEGSQCAPSGSGSIHKRTREGEVSRVHGCHGWLSHRGMVGEYGDVLCTS